VDPNIDKVKHYFSSSESNNENASKASSLFIGPVEELDENQDPNCRKIHNMKPVSNLGADNMEMPGPDQNEDIPKRLKRDSNSSMRFMPSINPSQPPTMTKYAPPDDENTLVSPRINRRKSITDNKHL
jgi:hypothetical protein